MIHEPQAILGAIRRGPSERGEAVSKPILLDVETCLVAWGAWTTDGVLKSAGPNTTTGGDAVLIQSLPLMALYVEGHYPRHDRQHAILFEWARPTLMYLYGHGQRWEDYRLDHAPGESRMDALVRHGWSHLDWLSSDAQVCRHVLYRFKEIMVDRLRTVVFSVACGHYETEPAIPKNLPNFAAKANETRQHEI